MTERAGEGPKAGPPGCHPEETGREKERLVQAKHHLSKEMVKDKALYKPLWEPPANWPPLSQTPPYFLGKASHWLGPFII